MLVVALASGVGWLVVRERLVPTSSAGPDERLAGSIVALLLLGCVAAVLAAFQPYALLFVLPSLYAWLWLPLEGRLIVRGGLYALGWLGPAAALVVLARDLGLSVLEAASYFVGITTVGYVPTPTAVLLLAWLAAAGQVGALAFNRYAPYADGLDPPPPGALRRLARRSR